MKYGLCWKLIGTVKPDLTIYASAGGRSFSEFSEALQAALLDNVKPELKRHFLTGIFDRETGLTVETEWLAENQKIVPVDFKRTK